jgi:thioredoxin reductase
LNCSVKQRPSRVSIGFPEPWLSNTVVVSIGGVVRSGGDADAAAGPAAAAGAVPAGEPSIPDRYDTVIIGGGPAGLSAGLNLVRARRRVLILDSNRPRHSATLVSHGFLTRDGVSPIELRRTGREEFEKYPTAEFHQALVSSITAVTEESGRGACDGDNPVRLSGVVDSHGEGGSELGWSSEPTESESTGAAQSSDDHEPGFRVVARGVRGQSNRDVIASTVLLATGLAEILPDLPSLRAFYGTSLHSCVECDGFEKSDAQLALIGESDDLAERALVISQWSSDLIVFTNGIGTISDGDEAALAARGIRVERRPISDVVGDKTGLTGVLLADGETIPRTGGFVRPIWETRLDYASSLGLAETADELVAADADGRTSVPGVFAAGDLVPPGPHQLIVAAGAGARAAAVINRYLIGTL